MVVWARTESGIASRAAPAVAKSSCWICARSGTGVAGTTVRSVTAPTHNEHSLVVSAAKSERTTNCRAAAIASGFMSVLGDDLGNAPQNPLYGADIAGLERFGVL